MSYQPGLHILLTVRSVAEEKLRDLKAWTQLIEEQVKKHQLQSLGSVQHSFEGSGGYTVVHCLTESHISIHTWPEFGLCTCDVFLSNFKKDNRPVVRAIGAAIIGHFGSHDYDLNETER